MGAVTPAAGRRLKMKDLERATGVGRETIRYYIREGLLPAPERPGRNVAWYDASFIERIGVIKDLQRKRYLPLQTIRSIAADGELPSRVEVQALAAIDGKLFRRRPARLPEEVAAVAPRVGLPVAEIRTLARVEAITITRRQGRECLTGDAVRLVELWAEFRRAGFGNAADFPAGNLRMYVDVVRQLAREELRIFAKGVVSEGVSAATRVQMAERGIEILNEVLGLLRKTTLLHYIHTGNLPETTPARRHRPDRRRNSA